MKKRKLNILVTAGPTQEMIDAVRFISNRSTGVMGYEIARISKRRHHKVTLISGPTYIRPLADIRCIPIVTVDELKRATLSCLRGADCLFMVAAVSDWRISRFRKGKIKRGTKKLNLSLKPTPDILKLAGRRKGRRVLVGFSLETKDSLLSAKNKLKNKNLDIVVSNKLDRNSNPFGYTKLKSTIIYRTGEVEHLPYLWKREIARLLLDRVESLCRN